MGFRPECSVNRKTPSRGRNTLHLFHRRFADVGGSSTRAVKGKMTGLNQLSEMVFDGVSVASSGSGQF